MSPWVERALAIPALPGTYPRPNFNLQRRIKNFKRGKIEIPISFYLLPIKLMDTGMKV
jgi:hypothetical protein